MQTFNQVDVRPLRIEVRWYQYTILGTSCHQNTMHLITRYDFLLVFYSDLSYRWYCMLLSVHNNAPYSQLCEKWSHLATKPEVHTCNMSSRRQRRTKPWSQATGTQNPTKFGHIISETFERRERTNRQRDSRRVD